MDFVCKPALVIATTASSSASKERGLGKQGSWPRVDPVCTWLCHHPLLLAAQNIGGRLSPAVIIHAVALLEQFELAASKQAIDMGRTFPRSHDQVASVDG